MYWLVRLLALTDPSSSADAIEVNEEVLAQSIAIVDREGRVIGGAFNETMPPFDVEPPFREDDPFLDTIVATWEPVYAALGAQDAEALTALSERYPAFREAYARGKVGHHLLVARSDDLPKGDAFEALGGVRVHFYPFQAKPAVRKSAEPLEGVVTSQNGFLSDKDSGACST